LFEFKPPARRAYALEGKAKILSTDIHLVFRGLKFEPVNKSRLSGTQKTGKKGYFTMVSSDLRGD